MASNIVSITALSPTSTPPADAAIRAVVTLIWPYSSSTKQCALLLADPDFRLRNKKGQVRVRFSGPSAEAVALGKLGIGDEVVLELNGAEWAESAARTPGKSVDGELSFAEEVSLQKAGGEWIRASGRRENAEREEMQTPAARTGGRMGLLRSSLGGLGDAVPIYSSPAFVRIARLSGDGFGGGYDPFTGEHDDLEAEGPRKRARVSFGGIGKWRLAGRSPSPEKEDRPVQEANVEADVNADVAMEKGDAAVEAPKHVEAQEETVQTPEMAPPSLPRLQMPQVSPATEGPSTPTLKPVPSSALPLPSPFPSDPQTADLVAKTHVPAAADSLSTTASASQPSLAFTQSLPDTADPDDDNDNDDDDDDNDTQVPTGIYAHNGPIEGTYREHMAHPELLSDTEEDEGMYDEHLRVMQAEAMRDEYQYTDEDSEDVVGEQDVEEVIEDMGEEPDESSDEDVEQAEKPPSIVEIIDDDVESVETQANADGTPHQRPMSTNSAAAVEIEEAASHQSPTDANDNSSVQPAVTALPPEPAPANNSPAPEPLVRKQKTPPVPQTPAKIPAGLFGLDGASSDTPQSTPQSERDRIMARTYSSLFGFGASPAPLQHFVQTSRRSGAVSNMERAKTGKASALRSASEELASKDPAALLQGQQIELPAGEAQQSAASQTPSNDLHDSAMSAKTAAEAMEVEVSAQEAPIEDATMADARSLSEKFETEPLVRAEETPAAILEAAIENESDVGMDEAPEMVAPATAPATTASPPSQVEVIDLESSDNDESAAGEPEHPSRDQAVEIEEGTKESGQSDAVHSLNAQTFPGSPTEVDSESDGHELEHRDESLAPSIMADARTVDDRRERGIPETLQTPDADSILPDESQQDVESVDGRRDMVIPETVRTQDAQSIHPNESQRDGSLFTDQMETEEVPATETKTKIKHTQSFHYFSFQSTTSAADESFVGEIQAAPTEQKAQAEVIELLSSSPAVEAEHQTIDYVVPAVNAADEDDDDQMSDAEAYSVAVAAREDVVSETVSHAEEEEEPVSDAEAFSREPSAAQKVAIDAEAHASEHEERMADADAEVSATQDATHDAAAASEVADDDDEHMSDAETFSPKISRVENASLDTSNVRPEKSVLTDASDAGDARSDASGLTSQQTEQQTVDAQSHAGLSTLPLSPEESQSFDWETQLPPPNRPQGALQSNHTHLPPTPQLTQVDSLIKEAAVVEVAEATRDPPSRHTRSGAGPTVVEPAPLRDINPDPPVRHTRSSADPALVEAAEPRHITPDPPARHTRSSVEQRHITPDPPARHTRSSVEPAVPATELHQHITPDPPSRHTRSSAEPTAEKKLEGSTQKTPARRTTRRSQIHSQAMGEIAEQRKLEEREDEDTIAVLSPLQKTPVRNSVRKTTQATGMDAEMGEPEQTPPKKSPAKKSLTARLSNVPDVISAWFSPRRSTRLHPEEGEAEDEDEPKQLASAGLSTALGYYTPLSNLSQKMNSQAPADNAIDIIAIVSDSTKEPERAKAGPKDYYTCFKVWDPSLVPELSVLVEVFRPWKAKLPMAEVGDVILLRGFTVKSRKRQPYLISSETSAWCVWRYAEYEGNEGRKGKKRAMSFSGIREEIKGPPVELGREERDRVAELREAWEKMN